MRMRLYQTNNTSQSCCYLYNGRVQSTVEVDPVNRRQYAVRRETDVQDLADAEPSKGVVVRFRLPDEHRAEEAADDDQVDVPPHLQTITVQVQFRYNSSTIQVQLRYKSGTIRVQFGYN